MGIRFAEKLKVLPVLGPVATTDGGSSFVNMSNVQWLTYLVSFGALTSDSTDTIAFTVECSTAQTTNATTVLAPFHYRLSAPVDTDTMGAIGACTSTESVSVAATDDNTVLIIDVDPAEIPSITSYTDHKYVRLSWDFNTEFASNVTGVIAVIEPRYPGNSIPSST